MTSLVYFVSKQCMQLYLIAIKIASNSIRLCSTSSAIDYATACSFVRMESTNNIIFFNRIKHNKSFSSDSFHFAIAPGEMFSVALIILHALNFNF